MKNVYNFLVFMFHITNRQSCPGNRQEYTAARLGAPPQAGFPVFLAPSSRTPVCTPRPRSSRPVGTWVGNSYQSIFLQFNSTILHVPG